MIGKDADVSVRFGAEWVGQKGIKDAQKGVSSFVKSARLLAGSFAAIQITQFAKESLAAFREDQKAALALTNTMKNLNLVMTGMAAEGWIQRLSLASGIVSEKLSPAFQDLIRTTGDYVKSQQLLGTAIDVSRSSGVDLETVSYDLARAYTGNTKGLAKYTLGLTAAQLSAMSFEEIVAKLNGSFAGSNAKYLESYAGKMDRLTTGADKAKEIIGEGLMSALDKLAGGASGSGITALVNLMIKLSEWTAKFISGIGSLAGSIGLLFRGKFKDAFTMFQQGSYSPSYKGAIPSISSMVQRDEQAKAAAKILKDQKLITDEKKRQLAIEKAKLAAEKQKIALEKASNVLNQANKLFDDKTIQLAAAAQGKLNDEDKVRVKLKQDILGLEEAIQAGNIKSAASFANSITQGSQQLAILRGDLAGFSNIENPFNAWLETIKAMARELSALANIKPIVSASPTAQVFDFSPLGTKAFASNPYVLGGSPESLGLSDRANTARNAAMNVNLYIDGQQVAASLVNSSNSGTASSSARNTGQFK
jgi:hypothetical protein